MAKHEQQAERMEREADRLEEQGDRVERRIDDARKDWEDKEHDGSVPGAQPKPGENEEGIEGGRDEPKRSSRVPREEETATGDPRRRRRRGS